MLSEKRQLKGINLSIHENSPCNRAGAGEVMLDEDQDQ